MLQGNVFNTFSKGSMSNITKLVRLYDPSQFIHFYFLRFIVCLWTFEKTVFRMNSISVIPNKFQINISKQRGLTKAKLDFVLKRCRDLFETVLKLFETFVKTNETCVGCV